MRFFRPIFLLIFAACSASLSAAELHGEIDREIAAAAGGPLAPAADDAEFLRRAWLDLAGTIPTAAEARAFLDDTSADKRARLIDRLLAGDTWARRAEQAVTVMLLERRTAGRVPDEAWHDWLRGEFAANRPWDAIVRELLTVSGDPKATAAAKFLADGERFDANRATEDVARLFLGMNLACAQCHDHPSIKPFKQAHFFGIAAFLRSTVFAEDKKAKRTMFTDAPPAEATMEFKSVFKPQVHRTGPRLPDREELAVLVHAKGEEFETPPTKDGVPGVPKERLRPALAAELTAPDNLRFARNAANRWWWLLMGRGLVMPLDQMHDDNPPTHPALLNRLAQEFAAHHFDVKWLVREIALSEAYQRNSRGPSEKFRAARLRGLSAEQLTAAIARATGMEEALQKVAGGAPETAKFDLKKYLTAPGAPPPQTTDAVRTLFVSIFGNPPGEPEVEFSPGAAQTLFLMNERVILDWLKPRDGNLAARLARMESAEAVAEELYLAVLTRRPTTEERAEVAGHLAKNSATRETALGELAWALLASAEFRLNH